MKRFLLIPIGICLIISACVSDNKATSGNTEASSPNMDSSKEERFNPVQAPKPSEEFVTKDSVKPISKSELEGLSGFPKDSLEMRIRFQQEVNRMNRAFKNSDFATYAKYILPSIVKKRGLKTIIAAMEKEQKERPLNYTSIVSGPLMDVADVIDEKGVSSGWYCLMPHYSTIMQNGQEMRADGYLVGYSPDMKKCYFLDITRKTDDEVFFMLPDLKFIYERLPRR